MTIIHGSGSIDPSRSPSMAGTVAAAGLNGIAAALAPLKSGKPNLSPSYMNSSAVAAYAAPSSALAQHL